VTSIPKDEHPEKWRMGVEPRPGATGQAAEVDSEPNRML